METCRETNLDQPTGLAFTGQRSRECKPNLLSDGVVLTVELRHKRVIARRGFGPPLGEHHCIVDFQQLVLHHLGKKTPIAPAPHLAPASVDHHKLMSAAGGEIQLDSFWRVVRHFDGESHISASGVHCDVRKHALGRGRSRMHSVQRAGGTRPTGEENDGGSYEGECDAGEQRKPDGECVTRNTNRMTRSINDLDD